MRLFRARRPDTTETRSSAMSPLAAPIGGMSAFQQWWAAQLTSVGNLPVDEQAALGVPAVSASLSLLAAYVTQMPMQAVAEDTSPARVIEPAPMIVRGPLGDARVTGLTFQDWIEALLRDLALWGNYAAVLGDTDWTGWPQVMYPLPVDQWSVEVVEGRRQYKVGELTFDAAEVFHVSINRRVGELVGRGLLNTHMDTLAAAIAAERWAARYFSTGTVPSVLISHPNPDLTQEQADDLKLKFLSSTSGQRAPVVTPVGTEVTVLPSDAESAQLVEARRWANTALAIALGVQPAMLGLEGPSMTYRNIAEVNQQTINTTVMRYLVPIEQQFTAQCLPRGIRARFAAAALTRADIGERITQALAAYTGGLITIDEARAMLDLQPEASLEATVPEPVEPATPALQVVEG